MSSAAPSMTSRTRPLDGGDFALGRLENQLVVDLEHETGGQALLREGGVQPDHRDLDDVRGRALEWSVQGHALGVGAHGAVGGRDVGDRAHPPEERRDFLRAARLVEDPVEAGAHARELVEVRVHVGLRLRRRDPELLAQRERRHSVEQREVDPLGGEAHLVA